MPFSPDEIDAMPPAVRVELQDRIACLYLKAQDYTGPRRRKGERPPRWPSPWQSLAEPACLRPRVYPSAIRPYVGKQDNWKGRYRNQAEPEARQLGPAGPTAGG